MWKRTLDDECRAFSHYLVGQSPTAYVLDKYRDAHRVGLPLDPTLGDSFDRFLVRISTLHPLMTRLVDVYTSMFLRGTLVRRKWVLLLAVVETCFPTYAYFDAPDADSVAAFCIKAARSMLMFCLALCLSLLLLAPVYCALSVGPALRRRLAFPRSLTAPTTPVALLAEPPADFAGAEAPFEAHTLSLGK